MPRPRGNNVKPSFPLRFVGSASDQSLVAYINDSPYLPQKVHLINEGTYVLESEVIPKPGEPPHSATIVLSTDNIPFTITSPVAVLKAATTNGVQLVAEY